MRNHGTGAALLVDAREAARMLSVSPRKLWGMTFEDSPGLPFVRCGRLVRYSPDDLRQWIDAQRKGGDDDNAR
ncbi:MAG: helix-turn-helix domain-containing protein [Pirellulales bacterium]|nr:helix-turn-helix domain-containing protein [Pirellulales bacterium]